MIEITDQPISPERIINRVKSKSCGCVVTYVGVIRDKSQGKTVLSVEYQDPGRNAENILRVSIKSFRPEYETVGDTDQSRSDTQSSL